MAAIEIHINNKNVEVHLLCQSITDSIIKIKLTIKDIIIWLFADSASDTSSFLIASFPGSFILNSTSLVSKSPVILFSTSLFLEIYFINIYIKPPYFTIY